MTRPNQGLFLSRSRGREDERPWERGWIICSLLLGVRGLIYFLLGSCDGRELHPAFRELAESTSGQALELRDQWELESLSTLTEGVLEGDSVVSFGSNVSNRKKRRVGRIANSRYSIPVDDSMEKMTVTVSTTRNTRGLYPL